MNCINLFVFFVARPHFSEWEKLNLDYFFVSLVSTQIRKYRSCKISSFTLILLSNLACNAFVIKSHLNIITALASNGMPLSSSANRRKDLRKTAKYTINWLQHIAIISMTRVIFNRPLFTVQYGMPFNCVPIQNIMARERYTWRASIVNADVTIVHARALWKDISMSPVAGVIHVPRSFD